MIVKSVDALQRSRDYTREILTISIYLFFIVISFRDYFFFVPNFSRSEKPIVVMQLFTSLGWVLIIFVSPILAFNKKVLTGFKSILFLLCALTWPISTLCIKILNYLYFGNTYTGYLADHPIFILMEWLIPAFYCYLWKKMRKAPISE